MATTRPGTALRDHLADPPDPRPDALTAFKVARRTMLRCERIDINSLAGDLGVSRVTIYRWVGSRQDLIGEILWSLIEPTIDRAREQIDTPGRRGVAEVLTRFVEAVMTNPGFNYLLDTEADLVMRQWTVSTAGFQPRLIEKIEQLLDEARNADDAPLPIGHEELAFATLRLAESFVYRKHITGEEPELDRVQPVLELLLR